ncbi:hypothetical protein FOZ63_024907 [Perkinsus olseni]|uniref:Uncharacterized protein n=1 Tax=Perkinsus olseni TaxID=32597 RepID=A0A7J6QKN7_PEROL|nr:hypothetical protein FOZ63_024907 [Perkinsus olseni]
MEKKTPALDAAAPIPLDKASDKILLSSGLPSILVPLLQPSPFDEDRTVRCNFGKEMLKGEESPQFRIELSSRNKTSTGLARCPETRDRPSFELHYSVSRIWWYKPNYRISSRSYSFMGVWPPWEKYTREQDPLAAVHWDVKDAVDRLYSRIPKTDKMAEGICAEAITNIRQKFPTYRDLCTKLYDIAQRALRAGGDRVKVTKLSVTPTRKYSFIHIYQLFLCRTLALE